MSLVARVAAVPLACATAPAAAQTVTDTQLWADLYVSAPVARGVLISGEVINRTVDDVGREGQIETRLEIGHPLGPKLTAWIGWVHFATYARTGANGIEDHAVEQLNWTAGRLGPVSVALRTRFEQRGFRGDGEIAWHLREQARFTLPLRLRGPALVAWAEPFVALNRTRGQPSRLDRVRSFAGVTVPIVRHVDLEAGYLNEYFPRPTVSRDNHALTVIANVRL